LENTDLSNFHIVLTFIRGNSLLNFVIFLCLIKVIIQNVLIL
jgi:hypothetical protein